MGQGCEICILILESITAQCQGNEWELGTLHHIYITWCHSPVDAAIKKQVVPYFYPKRRLLKKQLA